MLQISQNITTNEVANATRYSYLRDEGGQFRNPYDHGVKKNCSDFLINGYNEDIVYSEESACPEGDETRHIAQSSTHETSAARHCHQGKGNGNENENENGHVVIVDVNKSANSRNNHVHSSHCSRHLSNKVKTGSLPLGLGIGQGRNILRTALVS